MGFERFAVADPDVFDVANLNRQAGATLSTLGRPKVEVMREMARDVNPRIEIDEFPQGLGPETVEEFAERSDIGVNAIDFLRADLYPLFHDTFRDRGKLSVVGASPFAFGAAMTVIGPDSPSLTDFLGLTAAERGDPEAVLRRFVARMTPERYAARYLPPGVNEIRSPLAGTRISSTAAALHLCTALTAAEVLFICTGRRPSTLAPAVMQVDLLLRESALHPGG